jgi:hypothetical protein
MTNSKLSNIIKLHESGSWARESNTIWCKHRNPRKRISCTFKAEYDSECMKASPHHKWDMKTNTSLPLHCSAWHGICSYKCGPRSNLGRLFVPRVQIESCAVNDLPCLNYVLWWSCKVICLIYLWEWRAICKNCPDDAVDIISHAFNPDVTCACSIKLYLLWWVIVERVKNKNRHSKEGKTS